MRMMEDGINFGSEYRYSVTNRWTEHSDFFLNINSVYFQLIYIYMYFGYILMIVRFVKKKKKMKIHFKIRVWKGV